MDQQPAEPTDLPDWCPRCDCHDCGASPAEHTETGCTCETCTDYPETACGKFFPPGRIALLARQLGPLLSAHLDAKHQRRCLAVAHAAHHAMHDYDYPEDSR